MGYIDYEVVACGASCVTECGTVCFEFIDDTEITFNVYQTSYDSDTWFVDLKDENIGIAQDLGIEFDVRCRILDDKLIEIIFDAYNISVSDYKEHEINCFNKHKEDNIYKNMYYELIDVSADGVVEEGFIRIEIIDDGEKHEIQFDIRQENFGNLQDFVNFETDDDEEICKKLGIELDLDFQSELMYSYGKESS